MPRSPLSEEEIARFRERMCEVATDQFAEHGFQRVTMRALANLMGCSPMTPYRYFENKESIVSAARNRAFQRFGETLREATRIEVAPLEQLSALAHAYVGFAQREPSSYRIMFMLDQREFTDFPMADQAGARIWQYVADAVRAAVDARAIEGDILTLTHAVWVVVHGIATLQLDGKLVMGRGAEVLTDEVMRATMRGFEPKAIPRGED
jgi:AcrR family transcriptional regulator